MGKITTDGTAVRRVSPDRMVLTLCFFQRCDEVDQSIAGSHSQCEQFLSALQSAGFPMKQARLREDELSRSFEETPRFITSRTVELHSKTDLALCTWVYELIRRERFSAACSVRFELADPGKLRRALLQEAFADARAKAELLAAASGGAITGVESIGGDAYTQPAPELARAKGADFDLSSPNPLTDNLKVAEIERSESVRVTWLFD